MKITGRIEVFQGKKGLLAKHTAFTAQGRPTGSVFVPIKLPEEILVKADETATINITEGYLNAVTSKDESGENFTHFYINVKECEILSIYKKEVK